MFRNFLFKTKVFFHSLFFGLKSADDVISTEASYGTSDIGIEEEKHTEHIMQDFLRGEETQRVKETRDEYYRTLLESKKYHVDIVNFDEENAPFITATKKKSAIDFTCKIDLYNPEKLSVRVIQDNKLIPKHGNMFAEDVMKYGIDDFVPLITIKRNFIPKYPIENYMNKIVVRTINEKKVLIDIYTTMYASQFGKVDAIFIARLNELKNTNNKRSEITDLKEISFITDNAHGENDLCEFTFNNLEYKGINCFDGNFVLTFEGNVVSDGKSIVEKYRTKELDEKLEKHAVRDERIKNGVDIFTLNRKINKEEESFNFETQTFSLNNSDKEEK